MGHLKSGIPCYAYRTRHADAWAGGVNDERNNEPGDAVSPIDGIRRTFDLAVGELRRDVVLAVDRVKRKIKWTAKQQDAIVGVYKTIILCSPNEDFGRPNKH